jgi:hypothetical protein
MNNSLFENSVLMHYETPLPDDFDMNQVRSRVQSVSSRFDHYEGLYFKLYGVNDRMETAVNEYSSIYLWSDISAMRGFLLSDLFDNYAQAFARPSVRSWITQAARGDAGNLASAVWAVRQTFGIPRQTRAGDFLQAWIKRNAYPTALFQVFGFDARSWEAIDLTIWNERPDIKRPINAHLYHLIHVSLPVNQNHDCSC